MPGLWLDDGVWVMSSEPNAPRLTGRGERVTLVGKYIAIGPVDPDELEVDSQSKSDESPVLIGMVGSDDLFLPLFSDEEVMRTTLAGLGVAFRESRQILDPDAFLSGVPRIVPLEEGGFVLVRIILDPVERAPGTPMPVRFLEVQRLDGAAEA